MYPEIVNQEDAATHLMEATFAFLEAGEDAPPSIQIVNLQVLGLANVKAIPGNTRVKQTRRNIVLAIGRLLMLLEPGNAELVAIYAEEPDTRSALAVRLHQYIKTLLELPSMIEGMKRGNKDQMWMWNKYMGQSPVLFKHPPLDNTLAELTIVLAVYATYLGTQFDLGVMTGISYLISNGTLADRPDREE